MSRTCLRHKIVLAALVAVATFYLTAPRSAEAVLYQWRDEQGAIHFTNDPGNIPPAFRDSVKRFDAGSAPRFPRPKKPKPVDRPNPNVPIIAPLTVRANQYFARTRLNEVVTANLLLDTGASVVVISEEMGRKLGYQDFDRMPQVEVETAGGKLWTPIINLKRLRVAGAEAEDVEAVINPMVRNVDGLLGMSFLSQFKMEMDYAGAQMILKPVITPGEKFYGGKPEGWWRERLDNYYAGSVHYAAMAETMRGKADPKAFNVEQTAEHYRKLYRGLIDRAGRTGFPVPQRPEP